MLDPKSSEVEIAQAAAHCPWPVRTVLAQNHHLSDDVRAYKLNVLAAAMQARPADDAISLGGRIARMVDRQWWQRNLRRSLLRENEAREFADAQIRRSKACYVSDFAMQRTADRDKRNREILDGLQAVSDDGRGVPLLDAVDASVSNPKLRRAELMTRCAGFEEVAGFMGHTAVFLTLTCPSRFHRFDGNGKPNKNWTGDTPKDAQAYLRAVWARIRAEWKREGMYPYGFRVAEPHHDGCPHWHILLFIEADKVGWFVPHRFVADREDAGAGMVGIAGKYALEHSAGEPGAAKARFTCKIIENASVRDPLTGGVEFNASASATGYIAKYISKNIDGLKEDGGSMGLDRDSGTSAKNASQRVRTWASVWGIRQFQQIGGPSVTVWRQLRRLREEQATQLELFESARQHANRGAWAAFWMLQNNGEPCAPRGNLNLKPQWEETEGGKYGDPMKRVSGVLGFDVETNDVHELRTRLTEWVIVGKGVGGHMRDLYLGSLPDMTDCPEWADVLREREDAEEREIMAHDFARGAGGSPPPWACVNNCTETALKDEENICKVKRSEVSKDCGVGYG